SLDLPQLQRLHRMKTGALLTCACRMGGLAGGANEMRLNAVSDYGRHLGLAFQIVDDLLDVTASPAQMGKATGKDQAKGKNTYPALIGVDASRKEAQQHLSMAVESLKMFGTSAENLRTL